MSLGHGIAPRRSDNAPVPPTQCREGLDVAKILIVEDNPLNMELASDLLEAAGYDILPAATAEEGIRLASTENPDLILMDVALPGMDGLSATRNLKEDPQTRSIPVVALTSHAMAGDEERALGAGCAGYITKPIDTRRFSTMIAGFL
jgi:CheY-like chemotaxis protein